MNKVLCISVALMACGMFFTTPVNAITYTDEVIRGFHFADQDSNSAISRLELQDAVEYFSFHGEIEHHMGDESSPFDLVYLVEMDISDLLQVIQFFNMGEYHIGKESCKIPYYCIGEDCSDENPVFQVEFRNRYLAGPDPSKKGEDKETGLSIKEAGGELSVELDLDLTNSCLSGMFIGIDDVTKMPDIGMLQFYPE